MPPYAVPRAALAEGARYGEVEPLVHALPVEEVAAWDGGGRVWTRSPPAADIFRWDEEERERRGDGGAEKRSVGRRIGGCCLST